MCIMFFRFLYKLPFIFTIVWFLFWRQISQGTTKFSCLAYLFGLTLNILVYSFNIGILLTHITTSLVYSCIFFNNLHHLFKNFNRHFLSLFKFSWHLIRSVIISVRFFLIYSFLGQKLSCFVYFFSMSVNYFCTSNNFFH